MKMQLVSVYDRATQAYGRPMYLQSTGQAIRSFSDEVNRDAADNQLFGHPDDFDLYHLGEWDDNSGRYTLFENPVILIQAKQVKK
jgi:hypothetical protein